MLRVAFPTLVTTTVWAVLVLPTASDGKLSEKQVVAATAWVRWPRRTMAPVPEQDRLTAGPVWTPVPVRPEVSAPPCALELTVIEPVRVPVAVGVKVTLMVQLEFAASDAPQLLVSR